MELSMTTFSWRSSMNTWEVTTALYVLWLITLFGLVSQLWADPLAMALKLLYSQLACITGKNLKILIRMSWCQGNSYWGVNTLKKWRNLTYDPPTRDELICRIFVGINFITRCTSIVPWTFIWVSLILKNVLLTF